eukprot:3451742-Amphidinium_carterae.1
MSAVVLPAVGASIGVDPGFSDNADGLDRSILDGMSLSQAPRTSEPGKGPHRVPRGFDDGSGLHIRLDMLTLSSPLTFCVASAQQRNAWLEASHMDFNQTEHTTTVAT